MDGMVQGPPSSVLTSMKKKSLVLSGNLPEPFCGSATTSHLLTTSCYKSHVWSTWVRALVVRSGDLGFGCRTLQQGRLQKGGRRNCVSLSRRPSYLSCDACLMWYKRYQWPGGKLPLSEVCGQQKKWKVVERGVSCSWERPSMIPRVLPLGPSSWYWTA